MANKLIKELILLDSESQMTVKQYPVFVDNKWSKERNEKVHEAIRTLADVANGGTVKEIAPMILDALTREHRYLQQEVVEALLTSLNMYADARYDGRNRTAVAMCRVVSNELEAENLVIPKVTMEAKND